LVEIGVEELDWPAQSPDLNTIEYLWDELERRLLARPNHPTSVHTSLMLFWLNGVPQQSSGKALQKSGGCYNILMAMILE
jgi:hypothetical protein